MLRVTIRADMLPLWVFFCLVSSQFWTVSSEDIVVACGGFVKSDVEINYSLIEVRNLQAMWKLTASPLTRAVSKVILWRL